MRKGSFPPLCHYLSLVTFTILVRRHRERGKNFSLNRFLDSETPGAVCGGESCLAEHNSTNSIIQISTSINNVTEVETPQTSVSLLTRLRTAMSVPGFIISDICTLYGHNYSALQHRRWRLGSLTTVDTFVRKIILSRKERTHVRYPFCTAEHLRK